MIFTNKELRLSINIDDELVSKLIKTGLAHCPNEIGGFLIGYYSEDLKILNITDMIMPNVYKGSTTFFERETTGIESLLVKLYSETPKKYYVGEWHTHPGGLPKPSQTDMKAINSIVTHEQVAIKNPVFIIIGYINSDFKLGFYVPFKNKLYKYEQN